MDRFEVKNISRIMLDIESMDGEKLLDMIETTTICSDDVCDTVWKPSINQSDKNDGRE